MKQLSFTIFLLLIFFLALIFLGDLIFKTANPDPPKINYGVTFSPKYASDLKLDWKKVYLEMIDDLGVKKLRLPTYWDLGFDVTDYMLDLANKRGIEVLLVLGERQPRWPECHIPAWAKALTPSERREKLLEFIKQVVERYKDNEAVAWYQVENEPFLTSYGRGCDLYDEKMLKEEIDLVKVISNKPVVVTDSGELGDWFSALKLADIFGTTVYRDVYGPILKHTTYPLPNIFYNLKASLVKNILGQKDKKIIISELQAEPWLANNDPLTTSLDDQLKLFPLRKFQDNISYVQGLGFETAYLWGVEWWYFMKEHSHPEYLEYAKTLF